MFIYEQSNSLGVIVNSTYGYAPGVGEIKCHGMWGMPTGEMYTFLSYISSGNLYFARVSPTHDIYLTPLPHLSHSSTRL